MTTLTLLLTRLPVLALPPVRRWMAIGRERRRLAELSDHALRDIGVSRTAARREATRPFWDLPDR